MNRRTVFLVIGAAGLLPWTSLAQQTPQYTISTIAGNAASGYAGDGGPATQAQFNNPNKIAVDASGNLIVADQFNSRIRTVNTSGTVQTVAGNGTEGYTGDGKAATDANIFQPAGVAVDASGNIYFTQTGTTDSAVRKAPPNNGNISTVAGTSDGAGFGGDGGAATSAQVNNPIALAVDKGGNLYIADTGNNRIREIVNGTINTIAGNGNPGSAGDGGDPLQASLNNPQGIAVDAQGTLYIADTFNHRIRKVQGGVITTIVGTGVAGFSGDGGPATQAQLNYPKDVAVDAAGNLYVVDSSNFRVRMITAEGIITTIAGRGTNGYTGDGGTALSARLSFPQGIALGPNGNIYISDTQNAVIRLLSTPSGNPGGPGTTLPLISKVVSASACGNSTNASPGAWIEIHGSNLATTTRQWAAGDFNGNTAPTSLDGVKVSIAGQSAVMLYISSAQVNVQVPLTVTPGPQQLTLTAPGGTSTTYAISVNVAQPGLCQGPQVGGNQYVAAVAGDGAYILPASANIPGITSRPARPGEIITFFGNGFGPVSPSPEQGQTVQQANAITAPLLVFFGSLQADVKYAGLAPGFIGLYQFNVVVPNVPDSDTVPVTFALGNFAGAPTLYTSVKK